MGHPIASRVLNFYLHAMIRKEIKSKNTISKILSLDTYYCGNLEFNDQVADWCKHQGMTEGSLREPGTFVVERAFVEK